MSTDRSSNRMISLFLTVALVLGVLVGIPIGASAAPIGLSTPGNPQWEIKDGEYTGYAVWDNVPESGSGNNEEYSWNLYRTDSYPDFDEIRIDGPDETDFVMDGGISSNWGESPFRESMAYAFDEEGYYYFTVCAVGDGENYTDSEYAESLNAFHYVKPDKKLPIPTGLKWEEYKSSRGYTIYVAAWSNLNDYVDDDSFTVYLYDESGKVRSNTWSKADIEEEGIGGISILTSEYPDGKYRFSVKAISSRPLEFLSTGEEDSGFSDWLTIGTTSTPTPTPNPTPNPGGGSSSGSSGRGGSSGGGSSTVDGNKTTTTTTVTSTAKSNNVSTSGAVNQNQITSEVTQAVAAASGNTAVVQTRNATSISPATIRAMAAAAGDMSVILHADTLTDDGRAVQGRLYVEPDKLTGRSSDLLLSIKTDSKSTQAVERFFESHFDNDVEVVHCDQQGSFGVSLHIAAKVDLSKLDTSSLTFYSYDKAGNTFTRISNPNYSVDSNGYLHFYTERAGDIIVSDGSLVRK